MKKRLSVVIIMVLLLMAFAMPVQAAKIKLNKKKATIRVGKTVQLKVKGTSKKVKWSSSNKSVATVSTKGKVKGNKVGKATITAKVGKKKLKCKITVKDIEANTRIGFNVSSPLTIKVGETKTIIVTTDKGYGVSWQTNNGTIKPTWGDWIDETNDTYMKIKGSVKGTGILTVYDSNRPSVRASLTVNVIQPLTRISIYSSDEDIELGVGETEEINYTLSPSNASDKKLTWESSNKRVATVNSSGVVRGISGGTAKIKVRASNGVSAECKVTVYDVDIKLPSLPASYSYSSGSSYSRTTYSRCDVTKIEFDKNFYSSSKDFSVKMWIYGEKTYDYKPNVSSACKIGYKLYDEDGYVVESGTFYSDSVFPGEKFKGYCYLSTNLKSGKYILELLDVT